MSRFPMSYVTAPHTNTEKHRDLVLKAARTVLGDASDLVPQQKWRWVKIHNISLVRYMGKTQIDQARAFG